MKKVICAIIIIAVLVFAGYKLYPMLNKEENVNTTKEEVENTQVENQAKEEEKETTVSNEDMYKEVIDSYKNAYKEFDFEDMDIEEKLEAKYKLVSLTLIEHVARYHEDGINLTYEFYDINNDGTDELIVGASGSPGAIYSLSDENVVPIFFQDTMERGSLSIYDNGVILSSGAGGAALHYYEFGKITKDSTYEALEKIEEEYEEGKDIPVYRDAETSKVLNYKSFDEITEKYLDNANEVKLESYKEI